MILSNNTVTMERNFSVPVEKLYAAWSQDQMVQWWNALKVAEFDFKVGGKLRFRWHGWDGTIEGEFKEIIPNRRISFLWSNPKDPKDISTVNLEFEASEQGSQLKLTNEEVQTVELAQDHDHGWMDCLSDLDKKLNPNSRPESLMVQREFKAPIEMVFEAWTNPAVMVKWWNKSQIEKAHIQNELKEGGTYRLHYYDDKGNNHVHYGTYVEIDKPHRLAFSWLSDYSSGETLVEIDLQQNDNKTLLTLKHTLFRNSLDRDRHQEGWNSCFSGMEKVVGS